MGLREFPLRELISPREIKGTGNGRGREPGRGRGRGGVKNPHYRGLYSLLGNRNIPVRELRGIIPYGIMGLKIPVRGIYSLSGIGIFPIGG